MQNKSLKKNYIYNVIYQILLLIAPLVTTPHVSRVLGASGVGTFSYGSSIVSYFTLFAALGTAIYGQREISYVRDDRSKRTEVFWNTEFLSCISTIACLIIYGIFVCFFSNDIIMYTILAINIVCIAFDITWLFQGMEEFGLIVGRNAFFKILNIVLIFLLVRTMDDFGIYVLVMCILPFVSILSMWLSIPQIVDKPSWKKIKPFTNLHVVISLFIPTIAISMYTLLDKTMLGIFTDIKVENGYYEQALKLSKTALALVTALGTVMIPRIGYHYEKKEMVTVREYIYKSYQFVWFLGIPLCLGIIAVAPNLVPWFFGPGFDKVIPLLRILSFLILAIGINNVTGMQYLIPTKRQNIFTFTVLIGVIVNFSFNLILIPKWFSIGAALASVLAETVIAIVQIFIVKKEISAIKVISCSIHYWISGVIMFVTLNIMSSIFISSILNSVFMIGAAIIIYFGILLLLKDELLIVQLNRGVAKIKLGKRG